MRPSRDPLPDATETGPPPPGTRELAELPELLVQPRRRRLLHLALTAVGLGVLLVGLGACRMNAHARELLAEARAGLDADGRMPRAAPIDLRQPGARRAVLLIHGWASTPADWHDLPEQLSAEGVSVLAPLLPGHGTTSEEFAEVQLEQYITAVLGHFDDLQATHEEVCVAGFSMGAALALQVAEARDVHGVALMAPYFRIRDPWWTILPVRTWAALVDGWLPYVDSGPEPIALNQRENAERIVKYRVLPLAALQPLSQLGQRVCRREFLERVDDPLLMIVSEGDRAAHPDTAISRFELLGSVDKELETVQRSNHQLLHDYDSEQVAQLLLKFLLATRP